MGHMDLDLLNVLRPPFCTLTTHSWLNWIGEDEVGLKEKTRRHQIHQKDYIEIRPEAPEVRAKDLIPNFAVIGTASRLKAPTCSEGVKNPGHVAPTTRSLILVPPRPKEEVF